MVRASGFEPEYQGSSPCSRSTEQHRLLCSVSIFLTIPLASTTIAWQEPLSDPWI